MKFATTALACLLAAAPLAGQAQPQRKWSFGLYGSVPELGMHYSQSGDSSSNFDIKNDLGIKNDKMGIGGRIDYLGPRFGFNLDVGTHSFVGQNHVTRPIEMDGQTFDAGADVTSSITNTAVDLTSTIKVLRFDKVLGMDHFWLGVDVGIQAWYMQVKAEAKGISVGGNAVKDDGPVSFIVPLPIPQVGISVGSRGLNNMLEFRGKAHFFAYSGAKYTLFGLDARCYFLPWLGVRAFVENQNFDVPYGSIDDETEAGIDNNRFGFGVALRW